MPDQTTPTPRPAVFKVNGRPLPYELHPACAAWPLMPMEALKELAADIKANGLRDRLTLLDGLLLEGQNRMTACALNGDFNPPTEIYEGDDPVGFVISKNKHRRHMDATALAFVVAKLAGLPRGGDRGNQYTGGKRANASLPDQTKEETANAVSSQSPKPAAALAAEAGIPEASVRNAKAVLDKGTPEVAAVVQRERVPLRKAADYVRHTPKAKQVADPAVIRRAASQPKPRPILNSRPAAGSATAAKPEPATKPEPQAAPQPVIPLSTEEQRLIADQRPQIITQLAVLLRHDSGRTLNELVRLIGHADVKTLPQPTRVALARGFVRALGLTDADLRPLS